MNFFFDNNLSPRLARALDELCKPGHRVMHLTDKYPANTTEALTLLI
ncbi:MAG: hypothetical protein KAW14_07100 [Candidatus Aegiribacteria sp.]|nr:hypothetical protein [Candidatus Aegiribacteria sp.]